jgi:hypothetical protein
LFKIAIQGVSMWYFHLYVYYKIKNIEHKENF